MAASQTALAKSKTLPGFSLGYLNQGDRTTPLDYRFRASVGIPIWMGQNKASIASARTEEQAAQARFEAQTKNIVLELQKVVVTAAAADAQIKMYETDILPRNQILIETAQRMQAAGQIDYIALLRTVDMAFETRRQYLEQLQLLHEANIKLLYLGGK